MSKLYKTRPSVLLGLCDDYTAFCFDEACAEIRIRLENKEKPFFAVDEEKTEIKFSSMADLYKHYTED